MLAFLGDAWKDMVNNGGEGDLGDCDSNSNSMLIPNPTMTSGLIRARGS
jgi:hypothetical protein